MRSGIQTGTAVKFIGKALQRFFAFCIIRCILNGDFRQHEEPLTVVLKNEESDYEEPYVEFGS